MLKRMKFLVKSLPIVPQLSKQQHNLEYINKHFLFPSLLHPITQQLLTIDRYFSHIVFEDGLETWIRLFSIVPSVWVLYFYYYLCCHLAFVVCYTFVSLQDVYICCCIVLFLIDLLHSSAGSSYLHWILSYISHLSQSSSVIFIILLSLSPDAAHWTLVDKLSRNPTI